MNTLQTVIQKLRLLTGATTDLPELTATDPGLMTLDEFLTHRNPSGKHHPSEAYDYSLLQLNTDLTNVDSVTVSGHKIKIERSSNSSGGYVFLKDDTVIGVYSNGTLYTDRFNKRFIPRGFSDDRNKPITLDIQETKEVKYPSEYVRLVSDVAKKNREHSPELLQRIKIQDEIYELRADEPLKKDKGVTLVLLNSAGMRVAQASNEWGTTLITVVQEYRGKGLGPAIGKVWYEWNPSFGSGGFTNAGQNNAVRIWADRVREYMVNGWYSALVARGDLTKQKVTDITNDLPARSKPKEKPVEKSSEVLALIDPDNISFVLYDSRFFEDQDEKYILGYGFFRDSTSHGTFMYRIEYERPYWKLATSIALQMAKNEGERIYVGGSPGDMLEVDGIDNVVDEVDYVSLSKDILNLDELRAKEKRARKPHDPLGEIETLLLGVADSKWD